MWDLPGPGLEPVSPALAGGFLTTAPPGKSLQVHSWEQGTSKPCLRARGLPAGGIQGQWSSGDWPMLRSLSHQQGPLLLVSSFQQRLASKCFQVGFCGIFSLQTLGSQLAHFPASKLHEPLLSAVISSLVLCPCVFIPFHSFIPFLSIERKDWLSKEKW